MSLFDGFGGAIGGLFDGGGSSSGGSGGGFFDGVGSTVGGGLGGFLGGALGSSLGPIGTAVGGRIGQSLGSTLGGNIQSGVDFSLPDFSAPNLGALGGGTTAPGQASPGNNQGGGSGFLGGTGGSLLGGAIGSVAGNYLGGGNQGGSSDVATSSRAPWERVAGPLDSIINNAGSLYQQYGNGGLAAGFSDDQNSAFGMIRNQAQNPSVVPDAQTALRGFINADPTQVSSTLEDSLLSRVIPRINGSFSANGRSGSGAHGDSIARGVSEAIAPILYQSQEAAKNRSLSAVNSAPSLESAGYIGANSLLASGGLQQDQSQREIDAPYIALDRYNGIVNPLANAFASSQSSVPSQGGASVERPSILDGILGSVAQSFLTL